MDVGITDESRHIQNLKIFLVESAYYALTPKKGQQPVQGDGVHAEQFSGHFLSDVGDNFHSPFGRGFGVAGVGQVQQQTGQPHVVALDRAPADPSGHGFTHGAELFEQAEQKMPGQIFINGFLGEDVERAGLESEPAGKGRAAHPEKADQPEHGTLAQDEELVDGFGRGKNGDQHLAVFNVVQAVHAVARRQKRGVGPYFPPDPVGQEFLPRKTGLRDDGAGAGYLRHEAISQQ